MNLGLPRHEAPPPAPECPWKLGATVAVAVTVVGFGFWLPQPLYSLVAETARIIGGQP